MQNKNWQIEKMEIIYVKVLPHLIEKLPIMLNKVLFRLVAIIQIILVQSYLKINFKTGLLMKRSRIYL